MLAFGAERATTNLKFAVPIDVRHVPNTSLTITLCTKKIMYGIKQELSEYGIDEAVSYKTTGFYFRSYQVNPREQPVFGTIISETGSIPVLNKDLGYRDGY